MVIQVKVFSSERFNVEDVINQWLAKHPDLEIVDITQSQCGSISEPSGSYEDLTLTNLTVIVWYKVEGRR